MMCTPAPTRARALGVPNTEDDLCPDLQQGARSPDVGPQGGLCRSPVSTATSRASPSGHPHIPVSGITALIESSTHRSLSSTSIGFSVLFPTYSPREALRLRLRRMDGAGGGAAEGPKTLSDAPPVGCRGGPAQSASARRSLLTPPCRPPPRGS